MKKKTKQGILKIVNKLYELDLALEKEYVLKENDKIRLLLEEGIGVVNELLNIFKKIEGEECFVVPLLDEYLSMLLDLNRNVFDIKYNNIKENLDEKLNVIEKGIVSNIEEHLEVVFMPYKASMWDSLESVWMEASKDKNCVTHVVPIPYYDRNSDFSFGERHYEGNLFPDYVPVEHYEDYVVEDQSPDIIYIHNPYDQFNTVTSVEPRFYSVELKKHTQYLVYIPYFVIAGQRSEINMINIAIYNNADKLILQSKTVREMCLANMKKKVGGSWKDVENKLISLGSPKIDSIVNAKKDDFELPEKWNQIIANKKVVLYNTSIGNALIENEKFLEKIKLTLAYFKEKNDVVLWWRSHPLLSSMFQSIRTEYAQEYQDIVDAYKKEDYGIYDETPDLRRAIIYSDLYYGDRKSSLVTLFCVTGKPVVFATIQEEGKLTNFEEDYLLYYRDNSSLDVLKSNDNYDGTSGKKIHQYIKNEVLMCIEKYL